MLSPSAPCKRGLPSPLHVGRACHSSSSQHPRPSHDRSQSHAAGAEPAAPKGKKTRMGPGLTVTTGEEPASSTGQPQEAAQQPQASMRPAEAASAPEVRHSFLEGCPRSSVRPELMTDLCSSALPGRSVLARTHDRVCIRAMPCWLLLNT